MGYTFSMHIDEAPACSKSGVAVAQSLLHLVKVNVVLDRTKNPLMSNEFSGAVNL